MVVVVVGIGLIGGSMALALRDKGLASKLIGVDSNAEHTKQAVELGLVDEVASLDDAVAQADLIVLATPVNALLSLTEQVLNGVTSQVVLDVGSTKTGVLDAIRNHPKRSRFVATHPMWGTEYSGPEAAVKGAFVGKAVVICNKDESDADAAEIVERIYQSLGMHLVYMNAGDHDVHVAYVSHIS
ncbi:MAG: prephenate dehydrogenase/arogenate dehydrogenase family protein, partial [Chitinophagaceae bacterium]